MVNSHLNNREEVKKLLSLAIFAGQIMLKNGAEIYRVEDTVQRICYSKENISQVDAFVTPTGIFISLEYDKEVFTYLRRVRNLTTNLNTISEVNEFSRRFVQTDMSIEEAFKVLTIINQAKPYPPVIKAAFGGVAAACFTLMFGGTIRDFVSCVMVSFIVILLLKKFSKFEVTFFLENFIGAFLASLLSYLTIKIGLGENLDMIIIGSIMYLVPGVSMTNAVRDTMSGDFLSGQSKGMEAIFSALAIAFGVGLVLNFYLKGVI